MREKLLSGKFAYPLFGLMGILFVFFWKTEKDLADKGNILWTKDYTLGTLGLSLVLGILLGCAVCALFYFLLRDRKREDGRKERDGKKRLPEGIRRASGRIQGLSGKTVFCASLAGILICWLPAYLAYYPAICAYDAPVQIGQVMDGYFIDHHPIAHTLLIKGAILLGQKIFGDINIGIAFYTALQMAFLAAAFAFAIMMLHHRRIRVFWQVLMLGYAMVYPFHLYMSVSITKDTVFSSFFLILMAAFCCILQEGRKNLRPGRLDLIFFVSMVGMILFRNNGKYAMMVLIVFALLTLWRGRESRKLWARVTLNILAAFLVGNLALSAIFTLSGAEQGDKREMLSMPIQQLARCMIYHGGVGVLPEDDNTMDQDSRDLINDFLLYQAYQYYQPGFADPVKRMTNTYVVRYRTGEFLSTYFHLLGTYPGDFINAGLAVNAGYLYPEDISHAYVNVEEGGVGRGYVQTQWSEEELNSRGIYKDSRWESLHEKMETWADENAYLKLPVLKYLFVPGTYLWLYLLLAGFLAIRKRYRMLLPLTLVLGYYITLLLGPTVQLRYLYPVMIALPFTALLAIKRNDMDNSLKG